MTCKVCGFVRQFALNAGVALDKLANALLLGDPNETISRRTARARAAGHRWADGACRVLSQLFGRDHCGMALTPGTSGRELWPWSGNFSEPTLEEKQ